MGNDRLPRVLAAARSMLERLRTSFDRWTLRDLFDRWTLRDLAPAILAVLFVPFLPPLIKQELKQPLFADVTVFQYTGWCIRHGMRLYRDIGMADGPFIHYFQAAVQQFVPLEDRAFRRFDLWFQLAHGMAIGLLVAPVGDLHARRASRVLRRFVWAAVSGALWMSWYFALKWGWSCQREVYYADAGLLGTALLYRGSASADRRRATFAIGLGALLATTQAFGKPVGVMYPALGLLGLLMPDSPKALGLWPRLRAFAIGAGACVLAVVLVLLVSGSVSGYFRWCVHIPYVGNKFLFRMGFDRIFWTDYWDPYAKQAVGASVTGVAALACGLLPPRAIAFVLLPAVGFVSACLQGRGYNYHLIPMLSSIDVLIVVILSTVWDRARRADWADAPALAAALALVFAGYYGFSDLQISGFRWKGDPKEYDTPDHNLDDQKQAGLFVKEHTAPDDYVFAYNDGAGHAVLLSAQRRTASPFLHSYVLDPVWLLERSQVQPDAVQLAALTQMQAENRASACEAIVRHRPAALVFDNFEQVATICPDLRTIVPNEFDNVKAFGALHVYLRKRT